MDGACSTYSGDEKYKTLVGELQMRDHLGKWEDNGIFKMDLKQFVKVWTGFTWI